MPLFFFMNNRCLDQTTIFFLLQIAKYPAPIKSSDKPINPHSFKVGTEITGSCVLTVLPNGSPPSRTGAFRQAGIELPQFGKSVPDFTHRL